MHNGEYILTTNQEFLTMCHVSHHTPDNFFPALAMALVIILMVTAVVGVPGVFDGPLSGEIHYSDQ